MCSCSTFPNKQNTLSSMNLWLSRTLHNLKPLQWTRTQSFHKQQVHDILNQCTNLNHLHQTQAFMITTSLDKDNIFLSQLIHTSASLGFPSFAYSLFIYNHRPNIFLYNNTIWALSSFNAPHAIFLFNRIRLLGLFPDNYSFPFVLKAVVNLLDCVVGKQIHCQVVSSGFDSHVSVVTSLVRMYCSCLHVSYARKLFDEITFKRFSLWNAMIAGYAKQGDTANARSLFDCMPEKDKDVVSWTAIISAYTQVHDPNEAIALFHRMQLHNVQPDEIAILAVLSACADLGALELGEWIHNYIEKHKLHKIVPLCNSLIDMYAKSGKISKALEVFKNMRNKTIITWTTMIAGLALHGLGKEALAIFSCMEKARVKPNEVTFIAVLSACSHVGLVEIGRDYFVSMESKYGIVPKIEHYGCMIDLLGRAGYLQEATELVRLMPYEANAAVWGSLLAAATRCGDAELAAEALRHLIMLEPDNSGNYSLLSNTYAALGRWSESRIVRKVMRNAGVEKKPGVSFIEVNNRVYEFIAGDKLDVYFVGTYDVLHSINEQLKMVCPKTAYRGPLDVDD
ncbi:putative tetratricopeptide-like helical domain-containing protein [Lupinus albus]|uniref:Putative tetratricopeptide-like helical domain-containing protein n=1 Tax=Lupinus albus TaxID=3870 RepID=A0A6A4QQH6_LUPAL|nr:putative tetratricopeptide-like helical domain-containing protein [Lupinus albus]